MNDKQANEGTVDVSGLLADVQWKAFVFMQRMFAFLSSKAALSFYFDPFIFLSYIFYTEEPFNTRTIRKNHFFHLQ
jgi:hypothetical protein